MSNNYENPEEVAEAYQEHYTHTSLHLVVGSAVAGIAMLALILLAASGSLDWNEALFNASLIAVALVFVMIEHDSIGGEWVMVYCAGMMAASVAAGFVMTSMVGGSMMEAVFNPATLNFLFGGLLALAYYGMQTDPSLFGRIAWGIIVVVIFMSLVYMIPWESVPAGPVQTAGLWAESQLEPSAQVARTTGQAIHGCVTDPGACAEYLAQVGEAIIAFLQSLPIWPALEAIGRVIGGYAGGMSCMLQQGFTVSPGGAYDPADPSGANRTTPSEETGDCFEEGLFTGPDEPDDDDTEDDDDEADETDDDSDDPDDPGPDIPGVQ